MAHDLEKAQAAYQLWCETVRDPAKASTEGLREIDVTNRSAAAEYEVAKLPNGKWVVRIRCEYRCGNYFGAGTPWTEFPMREHCIACFLATARRHFGHALDRRKSPKQRSDRLSMKEQLANGIFGFIEPTPMLRPKYQNVP